MSILLLQVMSPSHVLAPDDLYPPQPV